MTRKKQGLGLWMCIALVCGNMIGSGVFLLPSSLAPYGGLAIIGWVLTAIGAVLLALVFAGLTRSMPREGGPYGYTRDAFGDFAGFWIAWGYWIALWVGNAAIAVAFTSYLSGFFPVLASNHWAGGGTAIALVWCVTLINLRGVESTGRMAVITTIIKLLPLLAIATIGLLWFNPDNLVFNPGNKPVGDSISAVAALTLWAFLGMESASVPAGDVENPEKTIPRATIIGTLLAAVVYIGVTVAVMGVLPHDVLASSPAPMADAARVMWGDWAYAAVGLGAVVSCLGAINGWSLMPCHVSLAAARDGLFPRQFARLNGNRVPAWGLVVSSSLMTLLLVLNYSGSKGMVEIFNFIILLATMTTLLPYAFTAVAELMFMARGQMPATGAGRRIVIASLAFVYAVWALYGSGAETVLWGVILLMLGLPVYVWMAKEKREAAEAELRG
ncbi:amino acid permease [Laribacter hongkongensis]|uniref:Arginine/agmatine antiporter n=1 Tax=Laribacter hongkongensis TaxID=168471 RepID=A0A248LEK3_9NEIS|nr:amino acid permease [Laribacter hongkongensis]ASJ23230.1 amino acid permease [Laribacter hongkongensis]MBE5527422.1 amino acid permease [Laribacter hongkongensis]MCG8994467.1 amino acid permease [Laribacter hongkongensis]MCG9010626.1 amino acid permease [Laribacter hongkongensis]MCG9023113.1 amino acid permease [Laribacter hongkongensis]